MRYIFSILIIVCFVSCIERNENRQETVDFSVKAKMIKSYDSTYFDNITRKTSKIRIALVNKSKEQKTFWIMSCSWQENFLINYPIISYEGISCDSNYPVKKILESTDSLVFHALVSVNESAIPIIAPRFGFLYIDTTMYKRKEDYHKVIWDRSKHERIFWSDTIYIGQKIYN